MRKVERSVPIQGHLTSLGQVTLPTTVKLPTETKLVLECIHVLHRQSDVTRRILANHCDCLRLLTETFLKATYQALDGQGVAWKLDNTVMYFNV